MIISGQRIAEDIYRSLKSHPMLDTACMAMIQVGHHSASHLYLKKKAQACQALGIRTQSHKLDHNTSASTVISLIQKLNHNPLVHGLLLQLPLPEHLDSQSILAHIAPEKDVDCLTPYNLGRFFINATQNLAPPTCSAIISTLQATQTAMAGSTCTILGQGPLVGKPTAVALTQHGSTVIGVHQQSPRSSIQQALAISDIVISAVGQPDIIPIHWLPRGSTVLDVGISKNSQGQIIGDIQTQAALEHGVARITPWVGGIGPVTVACLIRNLLFLMKP